MYKIQIGRAAVAGLTSFFKQFGSAVKIGWVPLLIMVVVHAAALAVAVPALMAAAKEQGSFDAKDDAATSAYKPELMSDLAQSFGWLGVVAALVTIAAYVMLTTGWLRHVLRGDALGGRIGYFRFGKREFAILGASLLIVLAVAVVTVPLMLVASAASLGARLLFMPVSIVLSIVFALVLYRLILVFPMVALDQGMGWRTAWQISKGNSWRLFWVYFLVSLLVGALSFVALMPIGVVMGVVGAFLSQGGVDPDSLAIGIIIPVALWSSPRLWSGRHATFRAGCDLCLRFHDHSWFAGRSLSSARRARSGGLRGGACSLRRLSRRCLTSAIGGL